MTTREPTEDEIRLARAAYLATIGHARENHPGIEWYMQRWDAMGDGTRMVWVTIVRAVVDEMRPMTDRQWETLPGLGKKWNDLSSREVWECFLECISPKVEPVPPPPPPEPLEWAKEGEAVCGKKPDARYSTTCVVKAGHKGACDDGMPF